MRVLVTGSNRGIGLQFVRDLLARGDRVWAGCRRPEQADGLQALAAQYSEQLTLVALDVSDPESIQAAARTVAGQSDALDLLINNAGVGAPQGQESLSGVTFDGMLGVLRTNTVGPLIMTQAFLDLLAAARGAKVVNLTSGLGSIGETNHGGFFAYAPSKAALNMVTKLLSNELEAQQIVVISVDPGWVQTDMGGPNAWITTETSVGGMLQVIDQATLKESGRFYVYDGSQRAW